MAPWDPNLSRIVDELANALQAAVLIAEHLERVSSTAAQDATALTRNLRRAVGALQKLRAEGGAP